MTLTFYLFFPILVLVALATAEPLTSATTTSIITKPPGNSTVSFPIQNPNSDPRALIPLQMMLPNGQLNLDLSSKSDYPILRVM
jgi:hypothetical protein